MRLFCLLLLSTFSQESENNHERSWANDATPDKTNPFRILLSDSGTVSSRSTTFYVDKIMHVGDVLGFLRIHTLRDTFARAPMPRRHLFCGRFFYGRSSLVGNLSKARKQFFLWI